jgi:8-oxo-dGTP diphosphatase
MIVQYVCGFMFSDSGIASPRILLIKKSRPKWQYGCLNGIGGKVEPDETPLQAMNREFQEEAGISGLEWDHVSTLNGPDYQVHFFSTWASAKIYNEAKTQTDEPLVKSNVARLWQFETVPGLYIMIELALDDSGVVKPVILTNEKSYG